jgi:hypothetical protein
MQQIRKRHIYEGHLESKERFAIKKYLLIIGKKENMQVLSHTKLRNFLDHNILTGPFNTDKTKGIIIQTAQS